MIHHVLATTLALALTGGDSPAPSPHVPGTFVVHAGEMYLYDTARGPVFLNGVIIEEGGILRVFGDQPLLGLVRGPITIDGTLDLSGFNARDVATLNTGHIPEIGGAGGPGGGSGGTGSWVTNDSTPHGGHGFGPGGVPEFGGHGGESGYATGSVDHRRPGGGGGGALAANQPVVPDPEDPANDGLIVERGGDGHPNSHGAVTQLNPAPGGDPGMPIFADGSPDNDFWGRMPNPAGGVLVGELSFPVGGCGGAAGGDAVPGSVFPQPGWTLSSDEKGGAGGGGGGLAFVFAESITLGPFGRIVADGGMGAKGENTLWLNSIGGNGGGGSGGYLVLEAFEIDLRQASDDAITALGGLGATYFSGYETPWSHGGNGGPGVIQLHTPHANRILLPAGKSLEALTSPDAHSLLPQWIGGHGRPR